MAETQTLVLERNRVQEAPPILWGLPFFPLFLCQNRSNSSRWTQLQTSGIQWALVFECCWELTTLRVFIGGQRSDTRSVECKCTWKAYCIRTLHSAHSYHFKHGHDLSLLLICTLARSTPLTPPTLNNDTTSHCSWLQHLHALQRSLVIIALPRHIPSPGTLQGTGLIVIISLLDASLCMQTHSTALLPLGRSRLDAAFPTTRHRPSL